MKKAKKTEEIRKENDKQVERNYPTIFHAPSKRVVEEATEYVADRFGRALTRLSDR